MLDDKLTIGLIVNPVAGMGGSVGLKGTDGEMYQRALERGAEPVAPDRTTTFLEHLRSRDRIEWLTAPGPMGGDHLASQDFDCQLVGSIPSRTSKEDTIRISKEMLERGVDLLVIVGGDGTARDVYDAVDGECPVVAVPSGVKVYSAVFATSPRAAAEMVEAFLDGAPVTEEEVLDIDEEAFRQDRLSTALYGALKVPEMSNSLQGAKMPSDRSESTETVKRSISAYVVERMDPSTLYFLGPGTTVKPIAQELGLKKTLLGIDAVYGGTLVGEDLNEAAISDLLDQHPQAIILVTPIGGNGFIFGRGNKPFTPSILRRVGRDRIRVVGTPEKIRSLKCLRVDTGDREVDGMLSGYLRVIIGYQQERVVKVTC